MNDQELRTKQTDLLQVVDDTWNHLKDTETLSITGTWHQPFLRNEFVEELFQGKVKEGDRSSINFEITRQDLTSSNPHSIAQRIWDSHYKEPWVI